MLTAPAGIDPQAFAQALADVRVLRPYGTYRTKPEKLPPTEGPHCGERSGYSRHLRLGERACERCRAANSKADRRLRETGTSKAVTR